MKANKMEATHLILASARLGRVSIAWRATLLDVKIVGNHLVMGQRRIDMQSNIRGSLQEGNVRGLQREASAREKLEAVTGQIWTF